MIGQIDSWNQRCIDLGTDIYIYIVCDRHESALCILLLCPSVRC